MDTFDFDSTLISPFIEILDMGVEKLLTPLLVLAALFAVIDGLWGYFQYQTAKEPSAIISKLIGKWIRYALTFGIMKIYVKTIIPMAYKIFAGIGNSFGEGFGDPLKIQNVWNIGWEEVNKLFKLSGDMEGIWIFVYIIFAIIAFLCLVLIMSTLTMVILSFHVVVRLAIIFLAFVPLETFSDIGKKALTSIVNSGTDLMVCVALSSMCFAIIKKHPFPDNVTVNNNEPQTMGIWLCVWLVSAFMVLFYEKISSMIISGQGGLTGSEFGKYTAGIVATTGVVAGAAVGLAAKAGGTALAMAGETWSKAKGASKGAEILKKSGKVVSNAGEKIGKGTTKTAQGTAKAIEMMTGTFEPQRTLASMIQNHNPDKKDKEEEKDKNTEETEKQKEEAKETNSKEKETKGETSSSSKTENTQTNKEQNENATNNENNKEKTASAGSSSTSGKTADTSKTSNTMNNSNQKNTKSNTGSSETTSSASSISQETNKQGSSESTSGETSRSSDSSSSRTTDSGDQNTARSEGSSATANKTADTSTTENTMHNDSFNNNAGETERYDTHTESYSDTQKSSDPATQKIEGTTERAREKRTTTFADEERAREKKKKNEG